MKLVCRLLGCLLVACACQAELNAQSSKLMKHSPPVSTGPRSQPLEFSKKLPLSVKSSDVEYQGHTFQLLQLVSIQFTLDQAEGHLQAEIKGSSSTFDQVNYEVSVAVLDASGTLLGTARSVCEVQRIWLGRVGLTSNTIELDFGRSLDYEHAARFLISISKQKVLTPDQWQKPAAK